MTENYIIITKKRKRIVIHSVLPLKDFVKLIDILVDHNYKNITEITEDEFHERVLTDCEGYDINRDTFQIIIEGFG